MSLGLLRGCGGLLSLGSLWIGGGAPLGGGQIWLDLLVLELALVPDGPFVQNIWKRLLPRKYKIPAILDHMYSFNCEF